MIENYEWWNKVPAPLKDILINAYNNYNQKFIFENSNVDRISKFKLNDFFKDLDKIDSICLDGEEIKDIHTLYKLKHISKLHIRKKCEVEDYSVLALFDNIEEL